MKGRIKDLMIGCNSKQILMVELDGDFRQIKDEIGEKDVEITVKPWRKKRSLDANALCWVLIGKLASALRLSTEEVYRDAIRQIGGACEIVCVQEAALPTLKRVWSARGLGWMAEEFPSKIPGCVNVRLFYGSSVYDTRQMSELIDAVIRACEDQGIPTITETEKTALVEAWGKGAKHDQ